MTGARDDRFAVVMITRNRRERACRAVQRLVELPERPHAVVVDNGSSDGTAEAIRHRFPHADVVEAEANLGAAGRNVGAERVATPYVAFCDDDTAWAPGALARAANVLDAHPQIALVTGRILVGDDGREDPTSTAMATSPLAEVPQVAGRRVLGFISGAAMVRRDAFLEVGGFERRLVIGGEEELLALDLAGRGWDLVYVPDVVVRHDPLPRTRETWPGRWQLRNRLWVCWLRYPAAAAAGRTRTILGADPDRRRSAAGLLRALAGLPWVLRARRPVPPPVAEALRLLTEADLVARDSVA